MVNKIWTYFLIIGLIFSFFSGNSIDISDTILNSATDSLNVFIKLFPVIALWLGIMNIATQSGLLEKLSKLLSKVLHPIFPDIPKNHESIGYMSSNIIANMFGLGSAATPFGLKAMESLQKMNKKKDRASKSMLTFTALNTSAITIYPTTLVALRIMHNSLSPSKTAGITIISTIIATIFSLLLDKILSRRF